MASILKRGQSKSVHGPNAPPPKKGALDRESVGNISNFSKPVLIQVTDETHKSETIDRSRYNSFDIPDQYLGSFEHLKKKDKRVYYEEVLLPPDPFCHVDVGAMCDSYFRGQKVRFKEKKSEHFASVVDLDAYEYHKVVFHSFLNEILQSACFRSIILILVMLNAIMIGMQTINSLARNPTWNTLFNVVDEIIVSVFIFEIILKWLYDFRLFWKVLWNILDFLIIFIIMFASVLPFDFGNGRALVTVRVVRAFRSLRSVSSMASLSIVSHTIIKSGKDMANIIFVLIIFMFVMSMMGVILFDLEEIEVPNFINGLDAWYTVFICVTQDGWADLLADFQSIGDEGNYDKLLVIYLLIAISAGGFVFANLIVAVIVTNLELAVKEFRDEKAMSDNPLEFHADQSATVDIVPVYELLANNNTALIAQRPFKIPSLRKMSIRRLQAYIGLIVALEHNMLEAEIIQIDLEKIMAVVVSTMIQLDVFKTQKELELEKKEALDDLNKFAKLMSVIPTDKIDQIEALEKLKTLKHQAHTQHGINMEPVHQPHQHQHRVSL